MNTTSKPVRLCVEGATTDGRNLNRQWLTDIEKNYDPETYGARINLEHFKSPWMPRFGDVISVFTDEIKQGQLAGKLALYGILSPTDELIQMNKKRQKVYTSVEINPNFSDTGSAYLVGLAVTDNPASLGTSMLQFSADNALAERKQAAENLFTAAEETEIEFIEAGENSHKPSLLESIKALFNQHRKSHHLNLADVHQSIELCATQQIEMSIEVETMKTALASLKQHLSQQDRQPQRPIALGHQINMENQTNC